MPKSFYQKKSIKFPILQKRFLINIFSQKKVLKILKKNSFRSLFVQKHFFGACQNIVRQIFIISLELKA
mgnify:CR=1 FL=1